MTPTKRKPRFTEEEREVLKRIYKVRAQMEKEMASMTLQDRLDYMNNVKVPPGRKLLEKCAVPTIDPPEITNRNKHKKAGR